MMQISLKQTPNGTGTMSEVSGIKVFVFCLFLLVDIALAQVHPARIYETNPNYDEGDWVSYSVAKFITSVAVGDQYAYFGTLHSGITRYDIFQRQWEFPWTLSNGLADNEIWVVAFDFDTGFVWSASHRAVSYYHPTSRRWHNSFKTDFGLSEQDEIESIGISRNSILLVARSGRLFESDKYGGLIVNADTDRGNPFIDGNYTWFGKRAARRTQLPHFVMSQGYLFNPEGIVEDAQFKSAHVVVSAEDQWGNLWLGTWGLGAGRGDVHSLQLEMLDYGLANAKVDAITFGEDVLWIGGDQAATTNQIFTSDEISARIGITEWDLDRETWTDYEQRNITNLMSNDINSILVDGDLVWFGTGFGLTRYSNRDRSWETYDRFDGLSDNIVLDVVADDSSLWIGTAHGIDRLDKASLAGKDSVRIESISADNLFLTAANEVELMENLLWAATDKGIYVYDTHKKTGGFSIEEGGPVREFMTSVSVYANEVWFGGRTGVHVFDVEDGEWLGVPEGRSFLDTAVNRIVAANDVVWAATADGVMKFDRKARFWRKFTIEDGLLDNYVNAILMDGDHVWFGSNSGITRFFWNDPTRVD